MVMVTRRARGTSRVAAGFTLSTFAIFNSRLESFAIGRRRRLKISSAAVWDGSAVSVRPGAGALVVFLVLAFVSCPYANAATSLEDGGKADYPAAGGNQVARKKKGWWGQSNAVLQRAVPVTPILSGVSAYLFGQHA